MRSPILIRGRRPWTAFAALALITAAALSCSSGVSVPLVEEPDMPAPIDLPTPTPFPSPSPVAEPDIPELFAEEAIALVQEYTRGVPFRGYSGPTCFEVFGASAWLLAQAVYRGGGIWDVYVEFAQFEVRDRNRFVSSETLGFC